MHIFEIKGPFNRWLIISMSLFFCIVSRAIAEDEDGKISPPQPDDNSLNRLIVIHQHGEEARNINFSFSYSFDESQADDSLPSGRLSPNGRRTMYQLGQALRSRYHYFLNDNPLTYQAESSDAIVSLESALLILHGMAKAQGDWIYDNLTNYLPIPVHTRPTNLDCILDVGCNCPFLGQWNQSIENHPTMRTIKLTYSGTIDYLVNKFNMTNVGSLINLTNLFKDLEYARNHQYPLPHFITPQIYTNLSSIRTQVEQFESCSADILSIRVTGLFSKLKEIIEEFDQSNASQSISRSPLLNLFSSSGLLFSSVLCALGVSNSQSTPDGSVLIIEIHNVSDQHYIQLAFWNESYYKEPYQLTPEYCAHNLTKNVCSVAEVLDNLHKHMLMDWDEKCGLCPNGYRTSEIMAIILCVIILTIVLTTCLAVIRQRKNREDDYEPIQ